MQDGESLRGPGHLTTAPYSSQPWYREGKGLPQSHTAAGHIAGIYHQLSWEFPSPVLSPRLLGLPMMSAPAKRLRQGLCESRTFPGDC
jgi:hypothetical protein